MVLRNNPFFLITIGLESYHLPLALILALWFLTACTLPGPPSLGATGRGLPPTEKQMFHTLCLRYNIIEFADYEQDMYLVA